MGSEYAKDLQNEKYIKWIIYNENCYMKIIRQISFNNKQMASPTVSSATDSVS